MLHKKSSDSVPESSRGNPEMLACDAKKCHMVFDMERCEVTAIRTLAAVWPAIAGIGCNCVRCQITSCD